MKSPKIVIGFLMAGVVAAAIVLACGLSGFWSDYLLIVCPPALALINDEPTHLLLIVEMTNIAGWNAAIYGLVGVGVSELWSFLRRKQLV
jgi:hypothetical protein